MNCIVFLTLSVICNVLLYVVIRYYNKYNIHTFRAIVFNYITAGSLGLIHYTNSSTLTNPFHQPWIYSSMSLGCLFISIFILIARTTQTMGVAVASVANKMSVIIPVTAAIIFYNDQVTFSKVSGIGLALAAVFLTSKKESRSGNFDIKLLMLPLVVFVGSGVIDALVNYAQEKQVTDIDQAFFISTSFYSAAFIGSFILFAGLINKSQKLVLKDIVGGIILGIPNYMSIYFMVRALNTHVLESSVMFPIANMAVVAVSALGGFLLFKEKLSKTNLLGIILSLLATLLITL